MPATHLSEPTKYVPIADASMSSDGKPKDFHDIMDSINVLNKYMADRMNLKMEDQLRHDIICEGINSLFEKLDKISWRLNDYVKMTINHRCYEIHFSEWRCEIYNEDKQCAFKTSGDNMGVLKNALYRAIFGEYSAGIQHTWPR